MLITGVQDLRTPMPQTEQFYSALKLLKVPTAMLRFNNEWHGTSSTPSSVSGAESLMARTVAWPAVSRVMTAGATGAGGPSITTVDCA